MSQLIQTQPPPRRRFVPSAHFLRCAEAVFYAAAFALICFFAGLITGVLILSLN